MTPLHPTIATVTDAIRQRSRKRRARYLATCEAQRSRQGPARHHLSCSNFAHNIAACGDADKAQLRGDAPNIAIVSAYNDILSAHQPYRDYPERLKAVLREVGATGQFAGGVPAMCDGVTQGFEGMELSLFSRDVIAEATAIALCHNVFDGVLLLGICDKIVPGMLIGALHFGHLPALFVPGGPMTSGIANREKAAVRQAYVEGRVERAELLAVESRAYHGPGTCTFYGTANSNQLLLEFMGLMLPGAAFANANTDLRAALTDAAARRIAGLTALGEHYRPLGEVVDERAIVNALVGLLATGGSTNHTIHWVAVARAAGLLINWDDIAALSSAVPLLARIYPNGEADVNAFSAAGGAPFVLRELLDGGLLHADALALGADELRAFTELPTLRDQQLVWQPTPAQSGDRSVVRRREEAFAPEGGLKLLRGNLGRSIVKSSAVSADRLLIDAPARCFDSQAAFVAAYQGGELTGDLVVVLRYQGPAACGMPELHQLMPYLGAQQQRGQRVALVTDGRLSGASGTVPAALHLIPEAAAGGAIAKVRDGDRIRLDIGAGTLTLALSDAELERREPAPFSRREEYGHGSGRELFGHWRRDIADAERGATLWSD
jgi:phosphogluconate dehydratase